MSRRRYFEEQRSGNGAIYHCVEIDTDHDNRFEVLDLMSKDESDTISPDKVNNVLNQLRQGSCFNIHTQSTVSFEVIEKRSNAIPVIPGQSISIRVGKGSSRSSNSTPPNDGGYSQFLNSNYRAYGGSMDGYENGPWRSDGGSGSGGGGSIGGNGGSDGGNGSNGSAHEGGIGQGHTTRDFGESSGKRNAAGGGGGGSEGDGGDGTVLIRGRRYKS